MTGRLVLGAAVAAALVVPVVAPTYHVLLMLPFMAYAVVLLGLNLLFGYTGLVSFGHALFIGVGAYAGAFLTKAGIRSLEAMLLVAIVLSAVVAAPVGALCVRYVRIYFGMLTLAFGMLFYTFLLKSYVLTGGDEGMPVLRPSLLGLDLGTMPKIAYLTGPYYYYYSLAVLALAAAAMWRIVHSPFGLCLRTIRDNPTKAETLGVSVTRYRWCAFVISAVYAAVGGALLGPPTGNVDPTLAYWTHSGNIVFMTLLGGFASFFGPMLGAFVFIYLQDAVMSKVPYWRLVFGALLAIIVIFAPGGLMGLFSRRRTGEATPT